MALPQASGTLTHRLPSFLDLVIWFWLTSYLVAWLSGYLANQTSGSGPQGLRHLGAEIHLVLFDLAIWLPG